MNISITHQVYLNKVMKEDIKYYTQCGECITLPKKEAEAILKKYK